MAYEIVHIEFFAADLGAAAKFYQDLFAWEPSDFGPDYTVFSAGEGPGGGYTREMPEGHPVIFYVKVEDIEGKLKEIEAAGGKTEHPKTKISDEHGYFAIFTDLHGVRVGLWSKS